LDENESPPLRAAIHFLYHEGGRAPWQEIGLTDIDGQNAQRASVEMGMRSTRRTYRRNQKAPQAATGQATRC